MNAADWNVPGRRPCIRVSNADVQRLFTGCRCNSASNTNSLPCDTFVADRTSTDLLDRMVEGCRRPSKKESSLRSAGSRNLCVPATPTPRSAWRTHNFTCRSTGFLLNLKNFEAHHSCFRRLIDFSSFYVTVHCGASPLFNFCERSRLI
jgi:hypothetical protein